MIKPGDPIITPITLDENDPELVIDIGNTLHDSLEAQALASLDGDGNPLPPHKDGRPRTLHGKTGELWSVYSINVPEKTLDFTCDHAEVLTRYNADHLSPQYQEDWARRINTQNLKGKEG